MLYLLASTLIGLAHASAQPRQTLQIAKYGTTPHGFTAPSRGWNSFGIQANTAAVPDWNFDQEHVQQQCDQLAASPLKDAGFVYCSLDSGWSVGGNGDDNGRLIPDTSAFSSITGLADRLHGKDLKLGVYVVPGAFLADVNKTILGTDVTVGSVCSGDEGLARCVFDYSQEAVQTWHDSVVAQFAEWYAQPVFPLLVVSADFGLLGASTSSSSTSSHLGRRTMVKTSPKTRATPSLLGARRSRTLAARCDFRYPGSWTGRRRISRNGTTTRMRCAQIRT